MSYKNAIVRYDVKPASEFTFNPLNPRVHPEPQRKAVQASLNEFGWVSPVIENETTGYLVDGHERIWDALAKGDDEPVPYIVVRVPADKEPALLAVFDKITTMATYDADMVNTLLGMVSLEDEALQAVLKQMGDEANAEFSWDDAFSGLPDNNHEFREVTFTVHNSQFEVVERALKLAIQSHNLRRSVNQNSNGNALTQICEVFLNANS